MSSNERDPRRALIERAMTAGRETGSRSILFHQAIAHAVGLNASDTRCLDLILLHGPAGPGELAGLTGLTTGAVTVLIDRLERAGLVQRRAVPRDRRRTMLIATPKAMRVLGPLYAPMARRMYGFMAQYSRRDLEFLCVFMSRMTEFWRSETQEVLNAAQTSRPPRRAPRRRA